jgi:2-polyprenyl-3-methyl-5-hydroxy-6-metoxy-1,4-benzoquinol methylase
VNGNSRQREPSVSALRTVEYRTDAAARTNDDLIECAARLVGYRNGRRYQHRGRFLFDGVSLLGMSVLDIGCGRGAWAIWTVLHGAKKSIGIEPEADGSTTGTFDSFRENIKVLGLDQQIEAYALTLQNLPSELRFDVVVLYNVINHLDEEAVVAIHQNDRMMRRYLQIVTNLRARINSGGSVIVADCARSNLWPALGLKFPFTRSIEWKKHQNPAVWRLIFENAGFQIRACRWSPLYPLGKLTTNRLVNYITSSHFVLTMRAI